MVSLAPQKNTTQALTPISLSDIHILLPTLTYSYPLLTTHSHTDTLTHTGCAWCGPPTGFKARAQDWLLWAGPNLPPQLPDTPPSRKVFRGSKQHLEVKSPPSPLCQRDLQLVVLRLQVCGGRAHVRGLFVVCPIHTGCLRRRWGFTLRLLAKVNYHVTAHHYSGSKSGARRNSLCLREDHSSALNAAKTNQFQGS